MIKIIATLIVLSSFYLNLLQAQTLDYCFVVVGCNRVDKSDVTDGSTANVYHLNRIFSEVASMNPLPKYFFFTGDLVLGYTDGDTVKLAYEYIDWLKLYTSSPLATTSVQLVVMPGNHEVENNSNATKALASAERTFVRGIQPYIMGSNGPKATGLIPGTDSLVTDQSQLTYSFNYGRDHFIVVNTDPVGRDFIAPFHWVNQDISAARNSDARHIFVFGHKPAYPAGSNPTDGLIMYPTYRNNFWKALENGRAEAMFSAHNHNWDTVHYYSDLTTWQVIAGNGGSAPSGSFLKPYYGYSVVNVYTNGKVIVKSMGWNINPSAYTANVDGNPTTLRATVDITYPTTINFEPFTSSYSNGPFSSQAIIQDNDSVTSAYLVYAVNGGTPDTIALTNNSGNVYKFSIPAQSDTAFGSISYKIVANGTTAAVYPSLTTESSFTFNTPLPASEDIMVYPNPATGILTIDLPQQKGISNITIQNVNGISIRTIAVTGRIIKADISTLPPAAYFLHFTASNGQQYVKKIIKN